MHFGFRPNAECSTQPQQHSFAKFCCCSLRTRAKHSTKDFVAETGPQAGRQYCKSQLRKRASPSDAHMVDKHNRGRQLAVFETCGLQVHRLSSYLSAITWRRVLQPRRNNQAPPPAVTTNTPGLSALSYVPMSGQLFSHCAEPLKGSPCGSAKLGSQG